MHDACEGRLHFDSAYRTSIGDTYLIVLLDSGASPSLMRRVEDVPETARRRQPNAAQLVDKAAGAVGVRAIVRVYISDIVPAPLNT